MFQSERTDPVIRRRVSKGHTEAESREGHAGRVEIVGGRYPFRPACSCAEEFRGYVAEHAAQGVLEAHLNGEG